jgi:ribosomal protein S18 acetylase RimI-like enzyme
VIRRATKADFEWIRDTAADVYRALGDYATIIPSWLEHTGVLAYVEEAELDGQLARRGFILLGFYEPETAPPGAYIADLLAIAVAPPYQRQGLGRYLLRYAIHVARLAGRENSVPELRLTVAETNDAGRRLFASTGFQALDEDHGCYEGGQRAIRMALVLDD